MLFQALKNPFNLGIAGDITGQDDLGVAFSGKFFDPALKAISLIGEGEFSPLTMHGLGNAPGDGAVAGDAGDQGPFSCQKSHLSTCPVMC